MSERTKSVLSTALMVLLAATVVAGLTLGGNRPPDRVAALGQRIRCPVCTSESIADSPADTARAMMEIVAEQVADGRTDDEIIAFFKARYGDGILLDPPMRGVTLLLWLLPAVALALGLVLMASRVRPAPESRHVRGDRL
jgi:cytochrome c-type biogenesis protein CcmH